MIIRPPLEIMKYVTFKNGEPVSKADMPEELNEMFEEYKRSFVQAQLLEEKRLDDFMVK